MPLERFVSLLNLSVPCLIPHIDVEPPREAAYRMHAEDAEDMERRLRTIDQSSHARCNDLVFALGLR